jgi:thioredoxin 1
VKVELFYTQGCGSCTASKDELRAAVLDADPAVTWRDIDPVKELDYAVELGVASLPSVAIDGKVIFTTLPTPEQLRKAVLTRRAEASNGR